jgi:hypothetical protein
MFDVRPEMMKRLRLLKNGLPLWDIRVAGDGSIWGEMIGTDKNVRALSGKTTESELRILSDAPSGVPKPADDYHSNDADVIVTVLYADTHEETIFLLGDVAEGSPFRTECETLIQNLIEREAEQQFRHVP